MSPVLGSSPSATATTSDTGNRPRRSLPDGLVTMRRAIQGGATIPGLVPYVGGDWKNVESGVGHDVVWDHQRGKYAMVYCGDNHAGVHGSSSGVSQFGIMFTEDIDNWDGQAANNPTPFFAPNTSSSAPDYGGVTFPQLHWDDATQLWHMFYIAFPSPGFEEGSYSSVCLATCPTLSTTDANWTRRGSMVASADVPWIAASLPNAYIYRPSVVRTDTGRYGMFFNGGPYGTETIGYAEAPALTGPWTASATPLFTLPIATSYSHVADPDVFRHDNTWYMIATAPNNGCQLLWTCPAATFPTGWTLTGPIWSGYGITRTVIVNTPKGRRLFAYDTLNGANGHYGPCMLKPANTVQPAKHSTWAWTTPTTAKVGTWIETLDATKPYGGTLSTTSNAVNDSLTFEVDTRCTASWTIALMHTTGTNRGIYSFYLDGSTTALGTIDGYSASGALSKDTITITDPPREGRHTLTVKMATKNASSSAYNATITAVFIST